LVLPSPISEDLWGLRISRHKICNEVEGTGYEEDENGPSWLPEAACSSALFRVGHGNSCSLHSSVVVGKQEKPEGRKCTGAEKLIHFQNWFAATFRFGVWMF